MASHSEVFVDEDEDASDSEEEEEEEYVPEAKEYNIIKSNNSSTMEKKKMKMMMKKKKITVWSKKDEIAILEGLIKFQKSSSSSSSVGKNNNYGYYSVIKDSLMADVSRSQLSDKIGSLKRKFLRTESSHNSSTDHPNLSLDSHSIKLFELSKEIWGSSGSEPEPEPESADAAAPSGNVFHREFHNYCFDKGLEVKWLEKHQKLNLQKLWKEFSELECDRGIIETKYVRKKNDLDEAIFVLLKHCYNSFPALFDTDY